MSRTIDSKVVEMKFDNSQFERNAQTSMSTLDKLKKSLNLKGASDGLENVGSAAKKIDMSGLGNGIQTVQSRFSALGVMGVTALMNITNAAVNTGKKIVSSLTVEPIMSGFQEYETKINSIQTILANTSRHGTSLDQVNKALDELNHYADKTIYNFTEMTRNIGAFTAAGVDLDTSVSAIKGIANLAAVSGSTSQQASVAMYQLSQAIASGTVKLMDWNSVVNAGMGGTVFQDALKDTARVHGIAIDQMIEDEGSFRDTLQKGWLTSDILTETLSKFTGDLNESQLRTMGYNEDQIKSIIKMGQTANDAATKVKTFTQLFDTLKEAAQSGWTESWEIIVGNFTEAEDLLTHMSDTFGAVIQKSADSRNNLLKGWKDLGGRTSLINALTNAFDGIASIIKPVKEAFRDIFPPTTAQQLFNITKGLENFTAKLKLGKQASSDLKSTFKGAFAVLDIGKQAFMAIAGGIRDLIGMFVPAGGGILHLTGSFGELLVKLDEAVKKTNVFKVVIGKLTSFIKSTVTKTSGALKIVGKELKEFGSYVSSKFDFTPLDVFSNVLDRLKERIGQVIDSFKNLGKGAQKPFSEMGKAIHASKIMEALQALGKLIKTISGSLIKGLGKAFGELGSKISKVDFSKIIDGINGLTMAGLTAGITKFVKNLNKGLKDVGSIKGGIVEILGGVRDTLKTFQDQIKAKVLKDIATSIAILTGAIVVLSLIDSKKLASSLGAISGLFANLVASMAIFGKMKSTKIMKASSLMIAMSASVLILAGAMKKLADLDWGQIGRGLVGIAGMSAIMVVVATAMSRSHKKVMKGATSMVIFAAALRVMAPVLEDLGAMSLDDIGKGLLGIAGMLVSVSVAMRLMPKNLIFTATGLVIVGSALRVMVPVLKDLGSMSWDQISRGLTALAGSLVSITFTMKLMPKNLMFTATGLVIVGAALKIIAPVLEDLGNLSWDQITRGLTALAGALISITLTMKMMPKDMITLGAGLVIVGAALKIVSDVMSDLGKLSWDKIEKGMTGIAGALVSITFAMKLMPKNMIGIATGLVIASAALEVLSNVFHKMSDLDPGDIAKSLGTIAIALGELALGLRVMKGTSRGSTDLLVASAALTTLVVPLKLLGELSLKEIGHSFVAIGASIAELAIGLRLMKGTAGGSAALLVAAGALTVLGPAMKVLGSLSWEAIAKGLVTIAGAFTVLGIAGAILGPLVPTILGLSVAIGILGVSALAIGGGLALAGAGIAALATGLTALGTALSVAATEITAGLVIIITGIMGLIPAIAEQIGKAIIVFCQTIADGATAIGEAVKTVVLELVDVLVECIPEITDGILSLIDQILAQIAEHTEPIVDSLVKIMIGIINGVTNHMPELLDAAANFVSAFMQGISDHMNGIDIDGLLKGIIAIGLLAGIMKAMAGLSDLAIPAMKGVLAFGAVVAEMGIVLAALGALAQIPGLEKFIGEGGDFLQTIGTAIGQFAGGIIGGFMGGVSDSFPKIGSDLSAFTNNVKPFIEGASQIDPSMMEGVQTLAKTILILTAADVLNGIASWLGGGSSIVEFGTQLAEFGPKFKTYADSVQGVDATAVQASAAAAQSLAEFATKIPNTGGLVSLFTGENSLSQFADELAKFGPKFRAYADSVTGIDPNVVTNTANAAQSLTTLASDIPNTGGLISFFTGDNDMGSFGQSLVSFGKSFSTYSAYMQNVDPSVVTNTSNAAYSLISLSNALPEKGGILSKNATLASFGKELEKFGGSFSKYASNVSGIDSSALSTSISNARSLISLSNQMGGANIKGMTNFSEGLKTLGKTSVSGFIQTFDASASQITGAANRMMSNFINAINGKKSSVNSSFSNVVKGGLQSINSQQSGYGTAGTTLMTRFVNGVRSQTSSANNIFKSTIASCLNAIRSKFSDFQNAGRSSMERFVSGVRSSSGNVRTSFTSNLSSAVSAIRGYYGSFYGAGSYLASGFANGINSGSFRASVAARAMAKAATAAAQHALDEHSPSKVFYRIGAFAGQGMINAFADYESKSYRAGEDMADSAKNGLSSAISNISDAIDGNIDMQPTIRPVLDLSDLENGGTAIDGMFGGRSISLASKASSTSESYSRLDEIADQLNVAISKLVGTTDDNENQNRVYEFNIPVIAEGREIAKASAKYTQQELNKMEDIKNIIKGGPRR